jgi:hypothetical protein
MSDNRSFDVLLDCDINVCASLGKNDDNEGGVSTLFLLAFNADLAQLLQK